jgi:hypothetical protein
LAASLKGAKSYDLALIPVRAMFIVGTLAWLRVDATEEIIPWQHWKMLFLR